ncbi:MAG: XdhC family protein, partial [Actinomycetota bacterium]
IEAQQLGQDATIACALVPATQLPESLWPLLVERATVAVIASLDGDDIVDLAVVADHADTDGDIAALLQKGESTVVRADDAIVTVLAPRPTLVAFGPGEIPAAMSALAEHFGWSTLATNNAGEAAAMASTLSTIDGVVVVGHDAEMTGRVLSGALSGEAGYIGSVGPGRVREAREEWLAYQGITDLQRVHSPAGLDIGARAPNEIALAVIAEMVAGQNSGAS